MQHTPVISSSSLSQRSRFSEPRSSAKQRQRPLPDVLVPRSMDLDEQEMLSGEDGEGDGGEGHQREREQKRENWEEDRSAVALMRVSISRSKPQHQQPRAPTPATTLTRAVTPAQKSSLWHAIEHCSLISDDQREAALFAVRKSSASAEHFDLLLQILQDAPASEIRGACLSVAFVGRRG